MIAFHEPSSTRPCLEENSWPHDLRPKVLWRVLMAVRCFHSAILNEDYARIAVDGLHRDAVARGAVEHVEANASASLVAGDSMIRTRDRRRSVITTHAA